MRIFEIILYLLIVLGAVRIFFRLPGRLAWLDGLLGAALLISAAVHAVFEGTRWQMIHMYGLGLVVLLFLAWAALGRSRAAVAARPGWGRILLGLFFLLLAMSSSLLPIFLPVPDLPDPGGPYAIGTETFYWVDETRQDPYDGQPRRLMVQVWYPVEAGSRGERSPYFENIETAGPVIAEQFGMPSFLLNHIGLVRTNSLVKAPLAAERAEYPVLLFSHGWTGIRGQSTFLMEELASHGYIVFSADHTYGAALTVFPDGEVALNFPDALPDGVSEAEYDRAARILGQTFVGDLRFVLDQAERLDRGEIASPIAGRLVLEQVGVLGHSTGGGAAVEFCYVDERCRAGAAMDAWMIPYDREIPAQGLERPFLLINSERWTARRNPPLLADLLENSGGRVVQVIITGTQHYDFADLSLVSPLAAMAGFKGPLPSYRVMEIVRGYTTAFFERAGSGQGDYQLDDLSAQYPEVTVERGGP